MGVRLYGPTVGRFLQKDPIPCGSANTYDYALQDPINKLDLDGRFPYCTGVPDRGFGFNFGSACKWHDACYRYHWCGPHRWGRYRCDAIFPGKMYASCRSWYAVWNPLRWRCYGIANRYYIGVRLFGAPAFYL
jgi:hypothetical protein